MTSLHQYFVSFTYAAGVGFGRKAVLQSDDFIQTADLHLRADLRLAGFLRHGRCSNFKLAVRPPSNNGNIVPKRERTQKPTNGASIL